MIIEKTKTKGPGGKTLVVIPLAPRALVRGSGTTIQIGDSATPGSIHEPYDAPTPEVRRPVRSMQGGPYRFFTASETHQGTRDYQQDALYVCEPVAARNGEPAIAFGVLCDGMGGMQSGGEASKLAVEEMRKELENLSEGQDIAMFFRKCIRGLDAMLSAQYPDGSAGTTMVSVVAIDNKLYWGSIGDSRVYLIRGAEILQVTRDHNYYLELLEKVEKGLITQAEADSNPKKEALISFIGSGNADLIDANTEPFSLVDGDIVLLCSDGINKSLTDSEVRRYISKHSHDLREAATVLVRTAIDIDMKPKDNTSVILIQYMA